ncbi:MAG: class I SAM-dependent methyltransferase [Acidimicrobiales bacterium]
MASPADIGSVADLTWVSPRTFVLSGHRFMGLREDDTFDHLLQLSKARSDDQRFVTMKTPHLYDTVIGLAREFAPQRVLEIGLFQGGSTAFLSLVAGPDLIVGVELNDQPLTALETYAESLPDGQRIGLHYGIDQGDQATILDIVATEFAGEAIDVVIDDASHALTPTRSSFEAVWPHIRPGGCYVIEDWGWEGIDFGVENIPQPDGEPIVPMVVDLVRTIGLDGSTVARASIDRNTATIVRSEVAVPQGWTLKGELDALLR